MPAMQSELIQSVRALAERKPIIKTCKPMPVSVRQNGFQLARPQDYDECDMRLVLAALERAERIEKAARTIGPLGRALPPEITADARFDAIDEAVSALDAALSESKWPTNT